MSKPRPLFGQREPSLARSDMHVILHLILKCDPLDHHFLVLKCDPFDHHLIINLCLYLVKENPPWQDPALSQRYNACDPPSDPSHPLSHLILKFDIH